MMIASDLAGELAFLLVCIFIAGVGVGFIAGYLWAAE